MSRKSEKARRRRARKYAEVNKPEAMVEKPSANISTDNSQQNQHAASGLAPSPDAALGKPPQPASDPKKNQPQNKGSYTNKIMWPFIAIRKVISMGVQFFDEHAGAITAVATLAIMGLTYAYVHISKQQWQVAQDSLSVSQRAYVTVGRKDGVIAEFVPPSKDKPDQATEIVIYFHNSGHVPARFTWGKLITLFAPPGSSRPSGIEYIPEYRPFVRIRNKDGSINESGASFTIAGDSDLVSTLGRISQKDLAELPGLNFWGEYMYCDELGNVDQRKFILSYRTNAPSSSLSFALTGDEPFPIPTFIPPRTDTSEGLNPCETSAEKIQNQQKQQTVSWYKPWTWF